MRTTERHQYVNVCPHFVQETSVNMGPWGVDSEIKDQIFILYSISMCWLASITRGPFLLSLKIFVIIILL
jgi:hypothetical protein